MPDMRALVIMHVENEGPGVFGSLLEAAGIEVRVARLHLGEDLPGAGEIDAALSMGGPMNVYEEDRYPFLRDETRFLQDAAARDLPVLGICLGAQMIAKAAGAAVTKNPIDEVGWSSVRLTGEGLADPLFCGLPAVLPVFQWHGDTFAIPEGGALLAEWFAGKQAGPEILRRCDELAPAVDRCVRTLFANFLEIARQARAEGARPG
jgi:GMP synthase-like glutamine amidotransferase